MFALQLTKKINKYTIFKVNKVIKDSMGMKWSYFGFIALAYAEFGPIFGFSRIHSNKHHRKALASSEWYLLLKSVAKLTVTILKFCQKWPSFVLPILKR